MRKIKLKQVNPVKIVPLSIATTSKDGLPYLLRHNQREHRLDNDLLRPHVSLPLPGQLEHPEDSGCKSSELPSVPARDGGG